MTYDFLMRLWSFILDLYLGSYKQGAVNTLVVKYLNTQGVLFILMGNAFVKSVISRFLGYF